MKLYLVRHGEAMLKTIDPARPLSDKGRAQASKMAAFLKPQRIEVEAIWHSGRARALQTAEILLAAVSVREGILEHDGLAPNDPVKPLAKEVTKAPGDLVIVGHLPFLDRLASMLLTGDKGSEFVCFDEAAAACLERDEEGRWALQWLVAPVLVA